MPEAKDPTRLSEQDWIDALERGRADVETGRTVDAEAFLRELEAEDAAEPAELPRTA